MRLATAHLSPLTSGYRHTDMLSLNNSALDVKLIKKETLSQAGHESVSRPENHKIVRVESGR